MAKERVTHTIDVNLSKEFNKLTEENAINKSALIEKLISNWIKKNKNKNEKMV